MKELLEQVIAGIAAGGIYASLALALVIIYRAMGLINFAQGEFAMFTAFICWSLLQGPQLPFAVAVIIAVVLGAVAAFAIERTVVRPFERGAPLAIVIVTLALFEITNSVAGFICGYSPRSFPSPFPAKPVDIGGILVSIQDAAIIGVSLVTLGLLYLLFNRTRLGLAMRAARPGLEGRLWVRPGFDARRQTGEGGPGGLSARGRRGVQGPQRRGGPVAAGRRQRACRHRSAVRRQGREIERRAGLTTGGGAHRRNAATAMSVPMPALPEDSGGDTCLSPDGNTLVLVANDADEQNLYTFSIDPTSTDPQVARQLTNSAGPKGGLALALACAKHPHDEGANVILLRPFDEAVWSRLDRDDGISYVAPSQAAADCLTGTGRMPAEGEALLAWMAQNEESWRVPSLRELEERDRSA